MESTSVSLLERLRSPGEQAAWERFVLLYTPLLFQWARRLGLHGQDEADLVQDVFALLLQKLPAFQYDSDQRFRGWLWTVTLNKQRQRARQRPVASAQHSSGAAQQLSSPDHVEAIDEAEYRNYLVRRATELMRDEFQPQTWRAFWEFVVEDRPAAEVAERLGMTENAVYLAKGRVLRHLRQELAGLLD
jgi:RNA polymerase sigma-70 factor (ECF subfamily)